MLRAVLAVIACFLLSACSGWVSDERLFGAGDWAPLALNGPFDYRRAAGDVTERLILKTRADGLIEGTGPSGDVERVMGLVQIRGGSGDFFLAVDRSDPSELGDEYYVARSLEGYSLLFYLPDCDGTSPVDGMEKVSTRAEPPVDEGNVQPETNGQTPGFERDDADGDLVCKFSTKESLMAAGLEAERFLSADHVVEVVPFAWLQRANNEKAE